MLLDSLQTGYRQIKKRKDMRSLPVIGHIFPAYRKSRLIPGASSSSHLSAGGSLTAEAACILPVFLSVILIVMYYFLAIQVEGSIGAELRQTAKELAVCAYAGEDGTEGGEVLGLVRGEISNACVKKNLISRLRDEGIGMKIIDRGPAGISLAGSSYDRENRIDIRVSYQLRFPALIPGLGKLKGFQRASVRAWVGREEIRKEGGGAGEEDGRTVYVTESGRVYHLDRNCTHIRLSVQRVRQDEIAGRRNQNGEKYAPCEICRVQGQDKVYITETGNRYHSRASCSGLKRTVLQVLLPELDGWEPCSRCGG